MSSNILAAQCLVDRIKDSLIKYIREFQRVKGAADEFVSWTNKQLEETNSELVVEAIFHTNVLEKRKECHKSS